MEDDSKYYDIVVTQTKIMENSINNGKYDELLITVAEEEEKEEDGNTLKSLTAVLKNNVRKEVSSEVRKQNMPLNWDIQINVIQPMYQYTSEVIKDCIVLRWIYLDLSIVDNYL